MFALAPVSRLRSAISQGTNGSGRIDRYRRAAIGDPDATTQAPRQRTRMGRVGRRRERVPHGVLPSGDPQRRRRGDRRAPRRRDGRARALRVPADRRLPRDAAAGGVRGRPDRSAAHARPRGPRDRRRRDDVRPRARPAGRRRRPRAGGRGRRGDVRERPAPRPELVPREAPGTARGADRDGGRHRPARGDDPPGAIADRPRLDADVRHHDRDRRGGRRPRARGRARPPARRAGAATRRSRAGTRDPRRGVASADDPPRVLRARRHARAVRRGRRDLGRPLPRAHAGRRQEHRRLDDGGDGAHVHRLPPVRRDGRALRPEGAGRRPRGARGAADHCARRAPGMAGHGRAARRSSSGCWRSSA